MKFFTNKSIWSKIILILIVVLLFEFVITKPTLASDVSDGIEFGGKLLSPVLSLVVTLGDAAMGLMHSEIMGASQSFIEIDMGETWEQFLWNALVWVVAAAVAIVIYATGIGGLIASVLIGVAIGVYGMYQVEGNGADTANLGALTAYSEELIPDTFHLPAFTISPEEIFTGKILMFDVDFFNPGIEPIEHKAAKVNDEGEEVTDGDGNVVYETDYYYYEDENGDPVKTSKQNLAVELRSVVSRWYVALRNIAIVMMLIVLLYVGIRILLSSTASDKAKYKQLLQDWLMGLLLIFLMHYIMAFSVTIVKKITKIVSTSVDNTAFYNLIPISSDGSKEENFKEAISKLKMEDYYVGSDGKQSNEDDAVAILYPTNMMGYIRIQAELSRFGTEYIGKAICYIILVLMTVYFVFTYLKRVLYMAFLTIIAPLMAVTYPIDKMNDGSAQGFSKWFKEYIFNLALQPLHLLLYYILVTSAWKLSSSNVIYSIVALGFMMPAEKLLRNFFGFEKAHTPGLLAGPGGAALTFAGLQKLGQLGRGSKGKSEGSSGGKLGDGGNSGNNGRTRLSRNVDDIDKEATMIGAAHRANDSDNDNDNNDNNNGTDNNQTIGGNENQVQPSVPVNRNPSRMRQLANAAGNTRLGNRARGIGRGVQGAATGVRTSASRRISGIRTGLGAAATGIANSKVGKTVRLTGRGIKAAAGSKPIMAAGRRVRAIGGVGMAHAKRTLKSVPKTLIKTAGATAVGSVALAAGVITGDPNKAFQYTLGGIAAGSALGNNLANLGISNEDKEIYNKIYNDKRYEDQIRKEENKRDKKAMKEQLLKNFDKEQVKEMTQEGGMIDDCLNHGVTKPEDIMAIQNMMNAGKIRDVKEGITIQKYASRVGDDYNTPKQKDWRNQLANEFADKAGIEEERAQEAAKQTMKKIKEFNGAKKDLYK